ncbi:hypothetical protein S7711_05115 [Stachybotrys chartarum IBT 7711]|uniref:DASH complex subunit DAD3 n=1 Tax=Stachybotrys chartarum (strain CBS 109288 / IBT 7711) TaxID=1280523 RepID=A0A084ANW6_STACB|nr:hypothetical protein S7711_05115 [Stachybotrys chartarum IBT 7711]
MPPTDRDAPREGERHLRHQYSASSDQGNRALIPMWDSSDPERAPPPLPLHPQSPNLTSRAGTSSAIQSAHAALSERARESSALVPAIPKRMPDASPERGIVKSGGLGGHRRMQSMQPGSVRDLSMMIESSQSPSPSPTRSPEKHPRPSTPTMSASSRDSSSDLRSFESESASSTPTPGPSHTPIVRPTVRRPGTQSILGENTPPQSSTMLALQAMPSQSQSSLRDSDSPLNNITNGSNALAKQTPVVENLSSQLLSLTNIATALQKEMSALSRRSRDNATDLLSLKEATKTRDEDIRKSLRDLVGSVNDHPARLASRDPFGGLYLDNKPHNTSPSTTRSFQLPRIPSPKSFSDSIDRGSISTPSISGIDGAQSMALLEKIIRDMSTKEGQASLIQRLVEVSEKLSGMATSSKVEELTRYVREQSENAIVLGNIANKSDVHGPHSLAMEYGPQQNAAVAHSVGRIINGVEGRRSSVPSVRGSELVNDDLMKIIKSVKDSVAQGGGLTAEVKALVRELRGEVLGMGRELGKRLEQAGRKGIEETESPSKDEVSRIIDEGLEQMKDQLNHVLREHRRASAASAQSQKMVIDYQEIYNAMRAALRDSEASQATQPDLSRDDVIEAVRDAWENYKPEIEVQQIGLERHEVLECLQQGLREYAPREEKAPPGATRDEVFKAVVEGLKHFVPPQVETPVSLSRDEIIDAVRDCLEEFEFPVAASAVGAPEITRADVVDAVREGLNDMDLPTAAALTATSNNDEIMLRLQDIMEYMKLEFRAVSDEAKDNVAANGRDTEQVLDATKDGIENLRIAIESYVDRVSASAGHEEFMDGLLRSMDEFKDELAKLMMRATEHSREQLQTELEGLREVVNSSMVPATPQPAANNKEVLEALQTGISSLRQEILRPRTETGELLDALNDGLNDIRAGIDRMTNKPVDLTANDEILDALKSGLDSVRSDIETLRDASHERAVAAVATIPDDDDIDNDKAVVPADMLRHDDIKNLEVLITQLRIKVEAMEPEAENVQKEDFTRLEEMLRNVQQGVEEISSREPAPAPAPAVAADPPPANPDAASKDDVQAIETILRNTKARLDDLVDGDQAVRKEHIDVVETLLLETRENMSTVAEQIEAISRKEEIAGLEALIGQLAVGLDEVKEHATKVAEDAEKVSKTDVEAVETVVLEIKTTLDVLMNHDFATMSSKEDMSGLETLVKDIKEKLEAEAEAAATAVENRQAEIVGVGERVATVKTFLEEFQEVVKTKLEEGSTGVESLGKLLEAMGEKIDKNENVGQDLKEMFDTMKTEFEDSKTVMAGAKLESDEKLQQAADSIATKIDDKITELIIKYDELQAALDEKSKAGEAREIETEAAVVGTKAVADELKLLIDTLGSTVTDSLEKMEEASKTVFSKVEDLVTRTDENHTDHKTEHQQTRDQIQQALSLVEGIQGDVKEYQPQILQAIKDVLLLVGEHFDHSKSSATEIQDKIVESKPPEQPLLPAPEKYDDSEVQEKLNQLVERKYDDSELRLRLDQIVEQRYDDSEVRERLDRLVEQKYDDSEIRERLDRLVEQKYDDTGLRERLDRLLEQKYDDSEVRQQLGLIVEQKYDDSEVRQMLEKLVEQKYDDSEVKEKLDRIAEQKYDDTVVHEKLDALVEYSSVSQQAFTQLDTLDEIRQAVSKNAAELSEFLSSQKQRIADDHEDREKVLQDTLLAIERKAAEKEHMEASILSLKDEEERLRMSVMTLRTEQESLIRQKTRLTGDVSSLETALRLRKEELFDMEGRAEGLERRILEGVMDHSRVLLMSKTNKTRDTMSRKRVKKPADEETQALKPAQKPLVNMALSAKRNLAVPGQTAAARRIVSLSQINSNMQSSGVKRSQSVRTPAGAAKGMRKRSWGGDMAKGFGEEDKENMGVRETVEEVEEPETPPPIEQDMEALPDPDPEDRLEDDTTHEDRLEDDTTHVDSTFDDGDDGDTHSDAGTLRRASGGTTVITSSTEPYTDSEVDSSEYYDETGSEWTESAVGSRSSLGTESMVEGGEVVLAALLDHLASNPSADILDGLRDLERKTSLAFTLLKASVYSIVLQQEIDWGGRDDSAQ